MTFLLALGGMLLLCLSMTRHQRDMLGRPLSRAWSRRLWWSGWPALILSFASAASGGTVTILCWIGELSIAAIVVVLSRAFVPARRERARRKQRALPHR